MEESHEHLAHPKQCFCQIPKKDLIKWAVKRYREGQSTVELLNSTDDSYEKEVISIVAMCDVDEKKMVEMMGDVNLPEHHIIHCREQLLKMIKEELEQEKE